ncbi:MAG: ribosome hibernation-promoting factor, HPF/YfiA family [Culicoidibacterales bacterium]
MKLNIRGQNVEVTPAIETYVTEKFSRLDRFFETPEEVETKILFKIYDHMQRIEATVFANRFILRIDEKQSDLYAAIDVAVDKLERQIRKHRGRIVKTMKHKPHNHHGVKGGFIEVEDADYVDDVYTEAAEAIVKTKRVELRPMDVEEAILQMELLGHDFFVYRDLDVSKVCVLYRRKDGKFGVIEPE